MLLIVWIFHDAGTFVSCKIFRFIKCLKCFFHCTIVKGILFVQKFYSLTLPEDCPLKWSVHIVKLPRSMISLCFVRLEQSRLWIVWFNSKCRNPSKLSFGSIYFQWGNNLCIHMIFRTLSDHFCMPRYVPRNFWKVILEWLRFYLVQRIKLFNDSTTFESHLHHQNRFFKIAYRFCLMILACV